jgi:subtilisin-like proprotein convertase family protein
VNATSYYITESNPSTVAYTDTISTYTRTDVYDYVLEIDADGNIHGGEWLGASRQAHPDFLWLPTATRGGNPHIDLANIHMLLEKSRAPELPAGETQPETDVSVYENEFSFDIPDNDATGVTSVITVHDTLTTSTFEVEVDIEHTFIGDLKVIVRKDGQESILHNKAGGSSDNIQRVFRVTDMSGIEASGNWELIIVDSAGQDTGRLISWKLKFGGAAETTSTESGSFTATSSDEVAIPDNDPAGAASVLTVADSRGIEALKVSINVRHSYVGALTVELSHGAIKHILHNSEGGSDNSIVKTYDVTAFNGDNSDGEWTLKVIDNDAYGDTGAIESWSLEFLY